MIDTCFFHLVFSFNFLHKLPLSGTRGMASLEKSKLVAKKYEQYYANKFNQWGGQQIP